MATKAKRSAECTASRQKSSELSTTVFDAFKRLREQNFTAFDKIDALEASEEGYSAALSGIIASLRSVFSEHEKTRKLDVGTIIDALAIADAARLDLDAERAVRVAKFGEPEKKTPEPKAPADGQGEEPPYHSFREAAE